MKDNLPIENWPEEHLQAATIITENVIYNITSNSGDKTCKKLFAASQNNGTFLWTRLETTGDMDDATKLYMMRQAKIAAGAIGAGAITSAKYKPIMDEVLLFDREEYLASLK